MYGTIARIRLKPGAYPAMKALFDSYEALDLDGFVGEMLYRMDDDPDVYMMAVAFDSRESYRANAEDPAQHERYLAMMDLVVGEPEWHDGEIVLSSL